MICLKCRSEIPDLSMYCPNCGEPQFARKETEEIVLELTDPLKSSVIVTEVQNMTSALSRIRAITGLTLSDVRKALNELPAVILSGISEQQAEDIASQLCEAGIIACADNGKKKDEPEAE